MSETMAYPVCFKAGLKFRFLLWLDGGSQADTYLTDLEGHKCVYASTKKEITKVAETHGLKTDFSTIQLIDLDAVQEILKNLRQGRRLSTMVAEKLLEFWNSMEDFSRSVGRVLDVSSCGGERLFDAVYEKLFYGNNLVPVRGNNPEFHPLLSKQEVNFLRCFFRAEIAYLVVEIDL